jgi:predicted TIM-barrel fold metal-dependent hydrolase
MRILDTHLHLVYPDEFTYPWIEAGSHLDKRWPLEAYFAEAHDLGIQAALHMEVDVAESDIRGETEFVLAIDPRVIGAIAACRPEHQDFPAELEWMSAHRGVKGLRRILHTLPDALSRTPLFDENLRRIGRAGLSFDFCLRADQLPIGMAHARAAPDTQFVLDHCGVPDVAGEAFEPWRTYIREMAAIPNVAAKISGVVAYARPDWTVATIRPWIEHVIESFGWDRVVWGSDHPVCTATATLTRWVNAAKEIVAAASVDEQEMLFHRNAERIYRVELPK